MLSVTSEMIYRSEPYDRWFAASCAISARAGFTGAKLSRLGKFESYTFGVSSCFLNT